MKSIVNILMTSKRVLILSSHNKESKMLTMKNITSASTRYDNWTSYKSQAQYKTQKFHAHTQTQNIWICMWITSCDTEKTKQVNSKYKIKSEQSAYQENFELIWFKAMFQWTHESEREMRALSTVYMWV